MAAQTGEKKEKEGVKRQEMQQHRGAGGGKEAASELPAAIVEGWPAGAGWAERRAHAQASWMQLCERSNLLALPIREWRGY